MSGVLLSHSRSCIAVGIAQLVLSAMELPNLSDTRAATTLKPSKIYLPEYETVIQASEDVSRGLFAISLEPIRKAGRTRDFMHRLHSAGAKIVKIVKNEMILECGDKTALRNALRAELPFEASLEATSISPSKNEPTTCAETVSEAKAETEDVKLHTPVSNLNGDGVGLVMGIGASDAEARKYEHFLRRPSPYEILEVQTGDNLSKGELRVARKAALLQAHPDKGGSDDRLALVLHAFDVLDDANAVRCYAMYGWAGVYAYWESASPDAAEGVSDVMPVPASRVIVAWWDQEGGRMHVTAEARTNLRLRDDPLKLASTRSAASQRCGPPSAWPSRKDPVMQTPVMQTGSVACDGADGYGVSSMSTSMSTSLSPHLATDSAAQVQMDITGPASVPAPLNAAIAPSRASHAWRARMHAHMRRRRLLATDHDVLCCADLDGVLRHACHDSHASRRADLRQDLP